MSVTPATQTSPPHSWTHRGVRVYNWDGVDTDGDSTLESVTVFKQSNWNDPGQLDYAEDVDWRGLEAPGGTLQIQLVGIADVDVDLVIKDGDGRTLGSSRKSGKESETVQIDLPAGRYFVVVLAKDPASPSGRYRVKVTALGGHGPTDV